MKIQQRTDNLEAVALLASCDASGRCKQKQTVKGHKMKTTNKALIALLTLGASASMLMAQPDQGGGPPPDGQRPPPRQGGPGGPGGPGGQRGPGVNGQRPPPAPLMAVLDANHDGVINADEIANASASLKALDKNNDGQLTQEELRPPVRDGMGGGPDGPPNGPNGPRGGGNRPPRGNGPGGPNGGNRPPPPGE